METIQTSTNRQFENVEELKSSLNSSMFHLEKLIKKIEDKRKSKLNLKSKSKSKPPKEGD